MPPPSESAEAPKFLGPLASVVLPSEGGTAIPSLAVLVAFLRALLAAKKSLNLYPPGSEMAAAWLGRLNDALRESLRQGLTFPIRVGRDRFLWAGEDLLTTDRNLELLRSELEVRGIAEFSIEPAVEKRELQAFLELLNLSPEALGSIAGAPAYLRDRDVLHVSVSVPALSGLSGAPEAPEGLAAGVIEDDVMPPGTGPEVQPEPADLFAEAVLEMVAERLSELTYDRVGLLEWFQGLSSRGQIDVLYTGIKTLGAMIEKSEDREVRMRSTLEAVLALPESTLAPLLTQYLVPLAARDLVTFNLLTRLTEDELAEIGRHVPQEQLVALTTELLEFPWEQAKRERFVEAVTLMVSRRSEVGAGPLPPGLLPREDPLLMELRQEILDACRSDTLLERSADVLLALAFHPDVEDSSGSPVEPLEDLLAEALERGQRQLALRIVQRVAAGASVPQQAAWAEELRRKSGGRRHVSLMAAGLREDVSGSEIDAVAEYLRLAGQEAVQAFLALLGEEAARRVRLRMCRVLARFGPPVIPALIPGLRDERWFLARNILYILGQIGDRSALEHVVGALDHAHPSVRMEAVRAAGLIAGPAAAPLLARRLTDPDPNVCRTVIRWLGTLKNGETVAALRDLVAAPGRSDSDLDVKQEALQALVSIGTPSALEVVEALAHRRARFWRGTERRVGEMAAAALAGRGSTTEDVRESDHGD